jgi:UDP-glucose 6-dehydrogenase
MNEIKKTMQDRKEEINKNFLFIVDKSTNLINNQSEMNKSISQKKVQSKAW